MITTPTFIIGLGGIGNAVVRLIRQRFLSTEAGKLPLTLFLRSIDTADQSEQATQADRLPSQMYTRLGNFNAAQVISKLDLYPQVKSWWKYPEGTFSAAYIDNGANARRPLGRLCFFQQFGIIHTALLNDFRDAMSVDQQNRLREAGLANVMNTPRVYIIGSLAGGTGAGMFIDVAMLCRHLLSRTGYEPAAAKVVGIFALPSVIHLASGDGNASMGQQRRANAAAALRELDFLMTRKALEPISIEYPNPVGRIAPEMGLFSQVYLFTDTKQGGHAFSRESDVLLRAAHFLYSEIALGTGEQTLQIMDNHSRFFDPSQQQVSDGLAAIYCSFGVEWLEVPRQKLLEVWCQQIGERVAALVADFEWDREPKKELITALQGRLPEQFAAYHAAIGLLRADAQSITAYPGLSDAEIPLQAIGNARNRRELESALRAFDSQTQQLAENVRRSLRPIPGSSEEDHWVTQTSCDLLSDRSFRLGGAKRLMRKTSELLTLVHTAGTGGDALSIEDIVNECRRGILGKIDPNPAIAWARQRLQRQCMVVLRSELGSSAARFARKCDNMAAILERMQHTVRDEGPRLGSAASTNTSEIPPETWLLDPQSIDKAIRDNLDEVSAQVADRVAARLALELGEFEAFDQAQEQPHLAERFRRLVMEAIETAAAQRTQRPEDTLSRIKGRMASCQPLAHIADSGNEYLEVMGHDRSPASIKLVVTGSAGSDRAALEKWEKEESARVSDAYHFQVVASEDPLRDDAVHLSLGWPLCLYREVQACERTFAQLATSNPGLTTFAYVMKEVQGITEHKIMPMDSGKIKELFGIALVLDHVRFGRMLDQVIFSTEVAGTETPLETSRDLVLRSALNHFRRSGYAGRYRTWLAGALDDSLRTRSLQSDIAWKTEDKLAKLEDAKISEEMKNELRELYKLAKAWGDEIVLL